MSTQVTTPRLTLRDLHAKFVAGEKLAMLTSYDAVTAALVEQAGVDMILVGDSLGNVVLGHTTTLPVTLDDMVRHTAAVVRGTERTWVIADLPFGTTTDPETALRASVRLMQETGCQAVKLEGGLPAVATVKRLVEQGIPVVAHIGLTPQSIHQLGGYYRHGKTDHDAQTLYEAAWALQEAGASLVVLECLVPAVAERITRELRVPTIGIGSGPNCAGQVLVINDLIGLSVRPAPKFARPRADVASIIRDAVSDFVSEVKSKPAGTDARTAVETRTPAPSKLDV